MGAPQPRPRMKHLTLVWGEAWRGPPQSDIWTYLWQSLIFSTDNVGEPWGRNVASCISPIQWIEWSPIVWHLGTPLPFYVYHLRLPEHLRQAGAPCRPLSRSRPSTTSYISGWGRTSNESHLATHWVMLHCHTLVHGKIRGLCKSGPKCGQVNVVADSRLLSNGITLVLWSQSKSRYISSELASGFALRW